ncbi:MAG: MFS transporter [Planctomycetota bacterium]
MTSLSRVNEFFGLRRSIVGLLGMVILVVLGEKMADRFLPIYLLALGGGAIVVGLFNGLKNLLGALYSLPGGYLADRLGTKRALLVFNLMAMTGYLIVIAVPAWQAVIVGAFFFLSWSAVSLPATMSLVAKALPQNKRTMGVSMLALVRRLPMAAGPVLGGLFIDAWGARTGVRLAFLVALAMAGVAIVLQQALIKDDRPAVEAAAKTSARFGHPLRLLREMNASLRNLLFSDILIRFCEQIPDAFVVIWCTQQIAAPVRAFEFGVLTAIEMSAAALVYIPVAYFADRGAKKPFVLMTFVFFTLFPLVLWYCQSFWPLVGAFVLRGLKDFGDATRKALILDLAPEDQRAMTFGLYYLIRDSIVSLAAFGGAFLWLVSPATNFLTAFAFGLVGTVWFALRGRDVLAGRQ